MRTPITVGLIGLGSTGTELLQAIADVPQLELRWLCDPNPTRHLPARRRAPLAHVSLDYDEALTDESLDAVIVAAPPGAHADIVRRALVADKHVLIPGLAALNAARVEELAKHAELRDRRLVVGQPLLFHPAVRRVGELVENGSLGELFHVRCERRGTTDRPPDERSILAHAPDLVSVVLRLVADEPIDVLARADSYVEPGVPDLLFVHFRFATGITAEIHLSSLDPAPAASVTVVGSRRAAVVDELDTNRPLSLFDQRIHRRLHDSPGNREFHVRPGRIVSPPFFGVDPVRSACEHFVDAVRDRTDPRPGVRLAAGVAHVLEEIERMVGAQPTVDSEETESGASVLRLPISATEGVGHLGDRPRRMGRRQR